MLLVRVACYKVTAGNSLNVGGKWRLSTLVRAQKSVLESVATASLSTSASPAAMTSPW